MARDDFNGDGRSDILWRDTSGLVTDWLATDNGGFASNWTNVSVNVPISWTVVGTGDFNGDNRSDILWRNDAGVVTDWLGNAAGGFTPNWAGVNVTVPLSWTVVGTGDFSGDGRSDILWRSSDGVLTTWLGNQTGGFDSNWAHPAPGVSTDWHVAGTGDFDGDHHTDILWQNDAGYVTQWFGTDGASFNPSNDFERMRVAVAGIGDFNGDARSDVIVLDDWGSYSLYFAQPNGSIDWSGYAPFSDAPLWGWTIAQVGDFNGDHIDDLLWRETSGNGSGDVTEWLGQPSGAFSDNSDNGHHQVATSWHLEPPAEAVWA